MPRRKRFSARQSNRHWRIPAKGGKLAKARRAMLFCLACPIELVLMATLILLQGQTPGRRFSCDGDTTIIGRQADCAVCLDDPAVSRKHARLVQHNGQFLIEDLGSSNGTYVNAARIAGQQPVTEQDTIQVGPYVLALRPDPFPTPAEIEPIVRSQVPALSSNSSLFVQNAAHKLQVVV